MLILDEPANGLDPAGIRWMRDLLRGYADRGGTVLLSSHLLHEIEVVADDIVMIGLGRIVSMGTKSELLHEKGTVVRAADLLALELALTTGGLGVTQIDGGALCIDADAARVGQVAFDAGIAITSLLATGGVILWAADTDLTYSTFATAIRFPVVIILPLIAILAVTGEWSQRTGLTTFTLVPHRGRVITAKAISSVTIAIAAMAMAFAVGALGNLLGAALRGVPLVWDVVTGVTWLLLPMLVGLRLVMRTEVK